MVTGRKAFCLLAGITFLTTLWTPAAAAPERVVSLAPSLTEMVWTLGAGHRVVGVTSHDDFPPEVRSLPKVGGFANPSLEAIVLLRPDLVLATADGNPRGVIDQLKGLGIRVEVITPRTLSDIEAAFITLGEIFGIPERGQTLAADFNRRRRMTAESLAGLDPTPTVVLLSFSPFISCSEGTFLDDLVNLAGGINLAADLPGRYPVISLEGLIVLDPAVIILAAMENSSLDLPPGKWKTAKIDPDLISRPGPRVYDAMEALAEILHPARTREQ